MKPNDVTMEHGVDLYLPQVKDLNEQDLDFLERAIHVMRLRHIAHRLNLAGFGTRLKIGEEYLRYILVHNPDPEHAAPPAAWATLEESQRLLDTVANLPPTEAFRRWKDKIEPLEREPYTKADALRDMRQERAEVHWAFQNGEIDSTKGGERCPQ